MNRTNNSKTTIEDVKKLATPEELELYSYVTDRAETVAEETYRMVKDGIRAGDGGLVFIYGPQNSGKTMAACMIADLLDNDETKITATQPDVDRPDVAKDRYYSRSGVARKVHSFKTKQDLEKFIAKSDVIIVDETQFIPGELQSYFLKLITDYIERGGWIIAIGILFTSQAGEFLLSAVLKDRAIRSLELTATCQKCGSRGARLNQRLMNGMPTQASDPELIAPSNIVSYEPRCNDCHVIIG